MDQNLDDKVRIVVKLLQERAASDTPPQRGEREYLKALEWIKIAPGKVDGSLRQQLIETFCKVFTISESDLITELEGVQPRIHVEPPKADDEQELERILPRGGYFQHYVEYTRYNESPMSYHVVSSLVALGCAIGRKCYVDMGHFKIYGAANAILIGPTGVVHKSTAVDIAKFLIVQANICPVMADAITQESLATSLMTSPQQFIPAGELSVFFGKQKYLEGLTSKILKLLDYPPEFAVETQSRGKEFVAEPTLSMLGGSTMSLLLNSTPDDVLSSGFLNRFLIMMEQGTSRCFPRPRKGAGEESLIDQLKWLRDFHGEIKFDEDSSAYGIYTDWYYSRKKKLAMDQHVAEVTQRGPIHLIRIALLMHAIECGTFTLCDKCISSAIQLLSFIERKAPELVRAIHSSAHNTSSDYVIEVLKKLNGKADHSTLLRRVASRLNSAQLKVVIQNLNEAGLVKVSKKGIAQYYILREEEYSSASDGH